MPRMWACAICGAESFGNQRWLLIVDNRWQDKLRILHWEDHLACEAGVWPVCGTAHLQELVVHWMITGSLDYPFARDTVNPGPTRLRGVLEQLHDVEIGNARQIGELAIHRESARRILSESPECVAEILHALLSAVDPDLRRSANDPDASSGLRPALQTM